MRVESVTQTYSSGEPASPLPVRLRVADKPGVEHTLRSGSCIVGAGANADFVIEDGTVSRRHVELRLTPEGVEVTDLGSYNGTFYMGQRLRSMVLALGSRVRLGRVEVCIEADAGELTQLPTGDLGSYGPLVGSSPAMRRVYALLKRLRGSLVSVLISGESGTGKDIVARTLHNQSLVASGPFVAVNCGALDRALVRSELFGHVRGAFTGAVEHRRGAFEAAGGGTLFLDEIGELPLEVQPVLLRALESGAIQRVGENAERKVELRLITATNRDLEELVAEGKFREDLYYRLLVVKLSIPPLRERSQDIPDLVRSFLSEIGSASIAPEDLQQLRQRNWPGNIRQLKNAVQAYAAVGTWPDATGSRGKLLDASMEAIIDLGRPYAELKEQVLERFLRAYVEKLMVHTNGNQTEAARISGMDRSHLNRVLRRLS